MSGISRRSLLGYSGTAAAGAALASGGPALAAQAPAGESGKAGTTPATAAQGTQAAPAFPRGTQFKGTGVVAGVGGELVITFSVSVMDAPASYDIPPIELADALNRIAQNHGWSAITFYGTPAPAPLTPGSAA
ncbi:twin-arginine translocation signal domain-containing protein [Streptomyces sp. NPDC046866]|uniref:twin-arginine translocation signal domain-containing protein n=1 Tax=Streptomyces sp. NPDC046866 TaxID=3154921 RepID=UPI0034546195